MAMSRQLSKQLSKSEMVAEISAAVMRWQDATERFDEIVGERLDLSSTERRCLAALVERPRPAREIASATGLTRAAVTTLVDRLEARGLVQRTPDTLDRRQVLVSMTPRARRLTAQHYAPIASEGAELLAGLTAEELATIRKFVEAAAALQKKYIDELTRGQRRPDRRVSRSRRRLALSQPSS
jgi:DNA-binding MarR family transcriptional regulator